MDISNLSPKKTIFSGVMILFVFFGGLGLWSYYSPMTGAVIAPGTVKVTQEKKNVQHLEGGIIDKIFIKEGDVVKKGDLLIRLKSTRVDASLSLLRGYIWFKLAEESRLTAENTFKKKITWPMEIVQNQDKKEVQDAIKLETDIFKAKRQNLDGKIKLYNSQISQLEKKILGAESNLDARKKILALLKHETGSKEKLLEKQYIPETHVLELRRRTLESKGDAGKIKQEIAETKQKIEELRLRVADIRNIYQEEATTELGDISDTIFELQEKIIPLEDEKDRLEIRAPISGEIMNLRVHSEASGIIRPGESILDILPQNPSLIIEALINKVDITKVHKGQETKVQLTAFNRRTVPPVPGKVIYISGDQIIRETQMGARPFYVAHVIVNEHFLKEHNAYLSPGMPTVCFITTQVRTVMEYLFEPLMETLDYALKES